MQLSHQKFGRQHKPINLLQISPFLNLLFASWANVLIFYFSVVPLAQTFLFTKWLFVTMWPDLSKFHHFREILSLMKFFESSFWIWQNFVLTLANLLCYWANFHCPNDRILKNNLVTLSRERCFSKKMRSFDTVAHPINFLCTVENA